MPATHEEHKSQGPPSVRCAVITVSDTRTLETDTGGQAVIVRLTAAGHSSCSGRSFPMSRRGCGRCSKRSAQRDDLDAILLTGGTGITSRDQTFETVSGLLTKPLPGYGEVFRMLSFQEIGPAAILSRAVGGLIGGKMVLTMPGSPAAVRLAMEKIIVPELPHLVREARR